MKKQEYGLKKVLNKEIKTAIIKLADLYRKDSKINQDYEKAFYWYNIAVEKYDNLKSMYYLGYFYYNGLGVNKDKKQGEYWIKKAASKGHERSKNFLKIHKINN